MGWVIQVTCVLYSPILTAFMGTSPQMLPVLPTTPTISSSDWQVWFAVALGLWTMFAGCLGGLCLPCRCYCLCSDENAKDWRSCLVAIDFLCAISVVVVACFLLRSDIQAYRAAVEFELTYLNFIKEFCESLEAVEAQTQEEEHSEISGIQICSYLEIRYYTLLGLIGFALFELFLGVATIVMVLIKIIRFCGKESANGSDTLDRPLSYDGYRLNEMP
ncbi:uncharacterized protein [Amphiura filiformis]|uniref:uncharacterized protein n=1 Tax=Amphiura filiformis TaxID=82378 RepID=UPI003B20F01B